MSFEDRVRVRVVGKYVHDIEYAEYVGMYEGHEGVLTCVLPWTLFPEAKTICCGWMMTPVCWGKAPCRGVRTCRHSKQSLKNTFKELHSSNHEISA